jgi:very-short-patch-repair endonuclease
VLDDLRCIRDYHRRTARVRDVVATHRENLVFDDKGQPDWEALHNGLDVIARLQSLIKIPDDLKQHLCSANINRAALHGSAIAVHEKLKQLEDQATEVGKQFSLTQLGEPKGDYRNHTSTNLETHLKAAEDALIQFLEALSIIESHLMPGADIAISGLSEACNRLHRLAELEVSIAELRGVLGGVQGTAGDIVNPQGVSADDVAAANATAEFVTKYGVRPASQVVLIATDAVFREQLRQATTAVDGIIRKELAADIATLRQMFQADKPVSSGVVIDDLSIQDLATWTQELCTRLGELEQWTELHGIKSDLERRGLGGIFDEVLEKNVASTEVVPAFLAKFYRQWLDATYAKDPVLMRFQVHEHESLLETFRDLDRDSIDGAYKRIRTKLLEDPERPRIASISAPPSSELGILLREASRKRPRMPLRQLFRKIPRVLRRIKPCVMMSPLAVSTYLDSPDLEFDVVIFDEASQVRPYDAIGAIYRGKQLLVAGDQKQLPPTRFFDALDADSDRDEEVDDNDDAGSMSEFESILDKCCSLGMPRKRLRWHYRSRRESLITFSNRFIYDNELITFPSVLDTQGSSAVTHHYVPNGRWIPNKSGGGFNPVEAEELVKLVVQQLEQEPDKSLGVITFNQAQQMVVDEKLKGIAKNRPDLAELLSEGRDEAVFVKNIETVQGDERDVIILGIVYGFNAENKFAMRFGPLNQQGGERRLNVAVTRARHKTIVVSSFQPDQIDLKRTSAHGAMLLRNYLDFANRGVGALDSASTESVDVENDSEFEAAVEAALKSKGLDIRRQIGCSGFRIDLAVVHPTYPGRYILGIECDGATYHSSVTARDRDRLRQEVLEGLGWTFCRIWSTDWVRNPERQINRVMAAYEEALSLADSPPIDTAKTDTDKGSDAPPEEPVILKIAADTSRRAAYANIDAVPEDAIQNAILQILRQCGRTTRDDLIKAVARQLGFQRTGRKIQNRVDHTIEQLAYKKRVNWAEEGGITAC